MKVKRILVVEDEPDIQKIMRLSLMVVGCYDVLIASSGAEALEVAVRQSPDLILLDVMLPEQDGYEIYAWLKQDPRTQDIPVIFISAKAQRAEVAYGLQLGAIGYIIKPFDPLQLPKQIKQITRQLEISA